MYWSRNTESKYGDNDWNPIDIETTSYVLLSYIRRGLIAESLPIMRWLIARRNSHGGFISTQVSSNL